MQTFRFAIDCSNPFADDVQLPSDDAAWKEALQLVRDIERSLVPGESWTLTVSDRGELVFRIKVETVGLRPGRRPPPANALSSMTYNQRHFLITRSTPWTPAAKIRSGAAYKRRSDIRRFPHMRTACGG
jgi:uncharacterized protein DUF6894